MVEVKVERTVGGVNETVRENGNPQGKRDIADAPEWMQHIFPCHELSEEQQNKTFHHAALESIPGKQAGNMDTQEIQKGEKQKKRGGIYVAADFLTGNPIPPEGDFLPFFVPETHKILLENLLLSIDDNQ